MDDLDRLKLAHFRALAGARGGRCLSTRYRGKEGKLRWECALGHRWSALPGPIQRGVWCPTCGHVRRALRLRLETLESMRKIAHKRGGVLLTRRYEHGQAKLEFRCAEGHRWKAVPSSIQHGTWCPKCGDARAPAIAKARKFRAVKALARKRGGECLSTSYVNVFTKLRWRCAEGHEWETTAQVIGHGNWCPRCSGVARLTLEQVRARARSRGGECLSEVYVNARTPLRWQCAAGHRWWATASNVMHQGTWCKRCFATPRDQLARLQRIARRHGGECLSKEYTDSLTHLLWRCRKGHEWWTAPRTVIGGSWCRPCRTNYGPPPVLTLEDMKAVAAERGGECLSRRYMNVKTHMRWRCARGHEWSAIPYSVRLGRWCPKCAQTFVGTLDGLRAWAAELGGQCLSEEYDDPRRLLRWECARGHRFEALAKAVKSGVWCQRCTLNPTRPRPPPPRGTGQRKRR